MCLRSTSTADLRGAKGNLSIMLLGTWRKRGRRALALLLTFATIATVQARAVERYEVIQKGDKDKYVLRLQEELHARGYLKSEPTGYFGEETEDALERYQESKGLEVDGKAGPEVQKKIYGKWYEPIPDTRQLDRSQPDSIEESTGNRNSRRYQVMQFGDKDEYVHSLQKELYARGYLKSEPTGFFGKETEEAVWNYQQRRNLVADGKAGPETQKAIYGKWYEEIPDSREVSDEARSSGQTLGDSSGASNEASGAGSRRYQVLQYGDKDDYVLRFQKELHDRGYLKTEPTGYFGKETQTATARYQEARGLESDGKAGPATQKEIYGKWYEPIPDSRKVSDNGVDDSSAYENADSIRNGDEGSIVKKIQKRLKELGYYDYKTTNYYGDITESAVIAFQKANGLTADGVAGKGTQKRLFSSKAKKSSGGSGGSGKKKSSGVKQQSTDGKATAKNITISAQNLTGKSYRTGGTGPNTFDCSGFVYYILKGYGLSTPRTSREMSQYSSWTYIENRGDLEAGDLVFFKSPGSGSGVGHVGIYLGGGQFIHCSSGKAKGVTTSSLSSGYYKERFKWGRRIFD